MEMYNAVLPSHISTRKSCLAAVKYTLNNEEMGSNIIETNFEEHIGRKLQKTLLRCEANYPQIL